MFPQIAVAALLLTLLPTVAWAAGQSDFDGFAGGIGVGHMHFDLKEFNRQDDKLVQESGWLPGIDATVSAEMNPLQARIRAAYYAGDIDYDGQTQSGAAIDSSSDQEIWDISALAAYRLPFSSTPRTALYAGGGYRHWQRDIQSVGSISGLDETYHWWSAQTGLNLEWRRGADLWVLDGRLTRTLNPRVEVDFPHTFESADLDLGERWGWISEFAWSHRLSPRLSAGLKAFYESWDLGKSGLETLTVNGAPAGSVFQPRIENRNYGFIVDLRHHW
ncbi:MAG: outer membrane beta-barrel protein [Thiogranum sp.]